MSLQDASNQVTAFISSYLASLPALMSNSGAPAGASVAAPAPAPAPAFNLTSPNTTGSTIMMAYGTGRLGGQVIWNAGIEANSDPTQTGLVTFMAAFCEPADPGEPIQIQKLWANGTQFYDYGVNPTAGLSVANLTPDAQSALDACVASMVLHNGGPGELPDATMSSILGADNVPANRGLRTITFINFPMLISGNAIPTISCLFQRTDTTLVRVDTCIQKIIDRYILRTGVNISFGTDGIDDECYGATVSNQGTAIDLLASHKDIYNFQIIDGDPIKIVRKPIASSLVIDLTVAEADIDRLNGAPTVASTRVNPAQLPISINFQYPDVDLDFDTNTQSATHEGTADSAVVTSAPSIFSVDNTTARQIAFEILYRLRSRALQMTFEVDNVETEVSDVIQLTMNEGDSYTILVEEATYTKTRATAVRGLALLTQAGADISGGLALDGGSMGGIYWPEECVWWDILPTASRIWSNRAYLINYNSNPPARKIGALKYATSATLNSLIPTRGVDEGPMFEDATYVYWLDISDLIIFRVLKNAANVTGAVEVLIIPAFVDATPAYYSSTGNPNTTVLKDGKLYKVWAGYNGAGSNPYKLVVVDIAAWDATAYNTYDWWTDVGSYTVDGPTPMELAVTDNGTIIIAASIGSPVGRVFYSSVSSPGTWNHIDLTTKPSCGTSSVNWVYCTDGTVANSGSPYFGIGIPNRVHHMIVLDCSSGTPSASYVDLTAQDSNIINISQRGEPQNIFASPDHLFVPCNYTRSPYTSAVNPGQGERPYLARLGHGTLANAGGRFIGDLIYAENELVPLNGRYFSDKLYLVMIGEAYDGRVLIVGEDLSTASATLYPTPSVSFPMNNNFSTAISIIVGQAATGNLFYASMDPSEPIPSWAWNGSSGSPTPVEVFTWARNAGHSVWYSFVAPSTATYHIEVGDYWGADHHSVQVYTGSHVASLTEIASKEATNASGFAPPGTKLDFAATAGTTYMISIRHDATTTFEGFSYQVGIPGERVGGDYTITIT